MLAGGGGGAFGYGNQIERHRLVVDYLTIPVPGLGTAWKDFCIVQISDLHLEPYGDPELLRVAVGMINGFKPDMVVMTGDYVTWDSSNMAALAEPLCELKAPAGQKGQVDRPSNVIITVAK